MQRTNHTLEYVLTFSSFYKAMYARDKLMAQGIMSDLRRVPAELIRSCGQALYIGGHDLQKVSSILEENQIDTKGIFHVTYQNGKPDYRKIK